MLNFTQGQKNLGDPTGVSRRPRRSVVVGSLGFLVAGVVLSATALPVMADAGIAATSVTTSSLVATTHAAISPSTHTSTPTTRAHHRLRATPRRHTTRLAHVVVVTRTTTPATQHSSTSPTTTLPTATTQPVTTTTIAPTPTTTVPVTTTTIAKSPPVAKVPSSIPNPAANIAPSPNFLQTGHCTFAGGVWGCDNPCVAGSATALSWPASPTVSRAPIFVLQAINNARAVEGVRPMVLPNNWFNLTTAEQLFVVADLERTARGLPAYVGINSALTADAQHAAAANNDPSVAAGVSHGQ